MAIERKELNSNDIDKVVATLSELFPLVPLLQMLCLGQYTEGVSVPQFLPTADKSVQTCNGSDQWVCATNFFSTENHEVYVYDSLCDRPSKRLKVQVSSLLRTQEGRDDIKLNARSFARQNSCSRDCVDTMQ